LALCELKIKENWEDVEEIFLDDPMDGQEEENSQDYVSYEEQGGA